MKKRRIGMFLTAIVIAGLLAALALILGVYWMETHLPPEGDADVILVLGAQVKEDGNPSIALERRLGVALRAYQEGARPVICCGGRGVNESAAEGDVMRAWLIEKGCREVDVLAETASVNTRENLINAKALMETRDCSRALIVTSDYHVPRALALARQVGIEACGRGSESKPEYFIKNHLREGLSWLKFLWESWGLEK